LEIFARVYARYVRDEKLTTVAEAVRKMTSLPASNLGIAHRAVSLSDQTHSIPVQFCDPASQQGGLFIIVIIARNGHNLRAGEQH
jgi:hypothetical protein